MTESPTRKLAVILHADVAGSTALVQLDETLAHERITDAFSRFASTIGRYGGTVHEIRGDALVAEFARASDAVCAALAFQQSHTAQRAELNDEIAPAIRIGISLGEVVFADGTVTGAGVVLAQRVEQLAEADGVCITAAVHEAVPERMPFDQTSLGEREVKGFEEPVRVYAVRIRDGAALPEPTREPAKSHSPILWFATVAVAIVIVGGGLAAWLQPWETELEPASPVTRTSPSIAVLPFNNLSDDPEQEYFSDGLTEDLITEISRISGLRVIARHSSFAYKGEGGNIRKISQELGARYVMEGSVRRSGTQVRINAQLIDAENGTHIWAERYDRRLTDMFELQDEVTKTIVSALAVTLTSEEERFLDRVRTANPDAYDALLRGLEPLHRFTREDSALARQYFLQATDLDPHYARAHANLALTHGQDVSFGWTDDQKESIRLALESIERAEALDDAVTQTHFARSTIYLIQKRYAEAETSIRRAIQLDSNYADGYGQLSITLLYAGQLQEALTAIDKAKRLNPRYPFVYLWIESHAYFLLGQHEKAIAIVKEVLDRNPAFEIARLTLIAAYGQSGMNDEASWEVDELLTLRQDYSIATARREALHDRPQDLDKFIAGLRQAGIPE